MGHRRLAGRVTETTIAGAGFLRIDVPGENGQAIATQFFAPTSVYALTPTTEQMARDVAQRAKVAPVQEWELPSRRALSAGDPPEETEADDDAADEDEVEEPF